MNQCPVCGKTLVSPAPLCPWCGSLLAEPSAGKVADNSKRLVAFFIDFALSGVAGALGKGAAALAGIVVLVFQLTYWAKGQSFGKSVMKLKVYRVIGQPATFGTMFVREVFGKILSAVVFGLGFIVILWDPEHRGWHDKIAGTVVIDMETAQTGQDQGKNQQ